MRHVVLYDIDSRIPNLALMKWSAFYKERGYAVHLARETRYVKADLHLASAVFHTDSTRGKIETLRSIYGDGIQIGGSGIDLTRRLPRLLPGLQPVPPRSLCYRIPDPRL
jgi:hypothetical protein